MTTAHSPVGPSSAHRWINCPGSVAATADAPDKATAHSIEGTAAHTLTEWCRLHRRRADEYLGETVQVRRDGTTFGVAVDAEMVDAVNEFLDFVGQFPGEAFVEIRVDYSDHAPGGFGTLDDARLSPGLAVITDFKYGQGVPVAATDNEQLLLYALGVYLEYDWIYEFENFVLAIVQPRIGNTDRWEITREQLLAWARDVLAPAAKAIQDPAAPLKAGEWCRWCRIRDVCKTRAEAVFETLVGEFDSLDDAIPQAGVKRRRETLTNDQIAAILTQVPLIEKWIKDIETHAIAELAHGHRVGDWKMVEGRGGREWGLQEYQIKEAWAAAGVDPLEMYETKVVTPAKAEKLIGKKHEFWQTPGLVLKKPGKPTLAPGSDKRPALALDPNTEFDIVEDPAD